MFGASGERREAWPTSALSARRKQAQRASRAGVPVNRARSDSATQHAGGAGAAARDALIPLQFSGPQRSPGARQYLREPLIAALVDFFERKGLSAVKDEDRREAWYEDWLREQAAQHAYARLLTPRQHSQRGGAFDLLRYARYLETCAYFSPAHGYSLHVTFLALQAILMGSNPDLMREAVEALDRGGLLAFGVSEQRHGSDLLANEFTVSERAAGGAPGAADRFVANGSKYYIGNANCAAIIAILARKEDRRAAAASRRAPVMLVALRPPAAPGFRPARKLHTLGVRSAFVGGFEVADHRFSACDVIADGRQAWDAVFGAISLGKFFLGFGAIGICERAYGEAAAHLRDRILYGQPAIQIPHIRATMALAYARLTAMKLFAYRALDYMHAAGPSDRRCLLFAAVQKAKVSTEGVKVMALLSECIGARGFETDTYFEMALRDAQLFPSLEGSAHINLGLTTQFLARYLAQPDAALCDPDCLESVDEAQRENPRLLELRTGAVHAVAFPHFLRAYRPFLSTANVRLFATQAKAFQQCVRHDPPERTLRADAPATLALGRCLSQLAYAQLVAEAAERSALDPAMVAALFHTFVLDFCGEALALASCPGAAADGRTTIAPRLLRRMIHPPQTPDAAWQHVFEQMLSAASDAPAAPSNDRRAE